MATQAAPALQPQLSSAARSGFVALFLFCIGHFFIDLYSTALPAFQPVLASKLHLTLSQAGMLGGLAVFASSVMQPAYGYLSDRFHSRMFSVLGPAVSGIFCCLLGIAPAFGWLAAMVFLGGSGSASFHPQAASRAIAGISGNRGRWMSVFISSGSLGLAIGPAFFSGLLAFGIARSWWGALPGVLITLLLLFLLPEAPTPLVRRKSFDLAALMAVWKPLMVLYLLVFIRSVVQIVYTQLLPLYLHTERGFSVTAANLSLSLYLAAGAFGGFVGGPLADRFGGRIVILVSMAGCLPFLVLFFTANGGVALTGLAIGGLVLLFTNPVNVIMAQELVPSQAGTVSALMMGFAWGMAGLIFIPLTGWAGDHFTLQRALFSLLVFPLLGTFLSLKLPK